MASSLLQPGLVTKPGDLASLNLSRDVSLPVVLSTAASNAEEDGYAEGVVTNTKFGSYPHSTLLGIPWGSQVRASIVDTGSRGRRNQQRGGKKRKADAISADSPSTGNDLTILKEVPLASSGFLHVLPPTPENWTTSLPHRTQVVYTPDYSYILHRLRARPGSVLLEAGSGSGSFTHAAARAVFDGATSKQGAMTNGHSSSLVQRSGQVFTFEYHPQRHEKVLEEMDTHRLGSIVHAAHRDVYKDGFLTHDPVTGVKTSPQANAIFLDLPAPWQALDHLTRDPVPAADGSVTPSALDPTSPVHICTFSPCIEQVQTTISKLRRLGWIEIEMVEVQHRRIDVRREFVGLKYEGMRSVNVVPATVDEAVDRLRENEQRLTDALAGRNLSASEKQKRREELQNNNGKQQDAAKLLYEEGRVVHRTEPDIKTHTSYLVFAVLPRAWTEEDERKVQATLTTSIGQALKAPKSHRQLKREAKLKKKKNRNVRGRDAAETAIEVETNSPAS